MSETVDVVVPDIGDFDDVPVAEILVAAGDEVAKDDPIVVLESDKASMEIPAPQAGKIAEIAVAVGDNVSEGSKLATLEVAEGAGSAEAVAPEPTVEETADAAGGVKVPPPSDDEVGPPPAESQEAGSGSDDGDAGSYEYDVLVLGSGPGGYSAAFRAADLGLSVVLVERYETLGGVCLNVGCIPSKALLHLAKVITDAELSSGHGVSFGTPEIDLDQVRAWKDSVVAKPSSGVAGMAKQRKVTVLTGEGRFTGAHELTVNGDQEVTFASAIVATGSSSVELPFIPHDDERVIDSTGALELPDVPKKLLVVGGGIIGLEMATVYDALGSEVTVVELLDQLIPGADADLVKPLRKRIEGRYAAIRTGTKLEKVEARDDGLHATFGDSTEVFDRVLVAVGRTPNGKGNGLEEIGVTVDERGFVPVDEQQRTNVSHIYAIGDVVGQPMLAHKASAEAHVAAEVIAGENVAFDARAIPSVAYTEPEVAWVGLTETAAKADDVAYEKAVFPWSASGRAIAVDGATGATKLVFDLETHRVLGAGIVGPNAGELIAELTLAIEMGADVGDVALTIHPHPTLSETVTFAAEMADGTITDFPNPKAKKR